MLYHQQIETCFDDGIGEHGLRRDQYDQLLAATEPAIRAVRSQYKDGSQPLYRLPESRRDLAELYPFVEEVQERFSHVVVLGTGGSSLGAQAVTALSLRMPHRVTLSGRRIPTMIFPENLDPDTFGALIRDLDLAQTGFLVVSKSGETIETLSQLLAAIGTLRRSLGDAVWPGHVIVITRPGDSPLGRLADAWKLRRLDHHGDLSGRFSVLSTVGLLPALIAGLDAVAVRAGAWAVLKETLDARGPAQSQPAIGAALVTGLVRHRRVSIQVVIPYADRLARLAHWHRQLWAESLGKGGGGSTPVAALGPVDQHSQLQLYLDGPADKMFTFIVADPRGRGPYIEPELARQAGVDHLAGRTVGDVVAAEEHAVVETLFRAGRPARRFDIPSIDERVLGGLLMHFMLETVFTADLAGVNPFDQPAVEAGKQLTRDFLARMGTE